MSNVVVVSKSPDLWKMGRHGVIYAKDAKNLDDNFFYTIVEKIGKSKKTYIVNFHRYENSMNPMLIDYSIEKDGSSEIKYLESIKEEDFILRNSFISEKQEMEKELYKKDIEKCKDFEKRIIEELNGYESNIILNLDDNEAVRRYIENRRKCRKSISIDDWHVFEPREEIIIPEITAAKQVLDKTKMPRVYILGMAGQEDSLREFVEFLEVEKELEEVNK